MSILLTLAAAALFGFLLFRLLSGEVAQQMFAAFQSVRASYVQRVGGGLKDAFVTMDANALFKVNAAGLVLGAVIGLALWGPVGAVLLVAAAYFAPRFMLARLKQRRLDAFIYQFPDALRSLAASLRAGANMTRGLDQIVQNQPPPLSQEFAIVMSEFKVGRDLADSLAAMHQRIPRAEVELFNAAVNISRSVGGDLADTLDTLASTLQEKATIEGKIQALTSMGRMQGWVVGLLPFGVGYMLYLQMPEEMIKLFTTPIGWAVCLVIAAALALAAWMIRKIVNIDV